MKKLINKTENIVTEMLEGIAAANPDKLVKVENNKSKEEDYLYSLIKKYAKVEGDNYG